MKTNHDLISRALAVHPQALIARLIRGASGLLQVDEQRRLTAWLFLKALALVYLAAFASLAPQIAGLAGPEGILPFEQLLANAWQQAGVMAWLWMPSLFWLDSSALALQGAAWLGCGFALLLLFGIVPRTSLLLMFVLYLSLFHAGQVFLNFQWDYLLLETGLLALFVVNGPSRLVVLLLHWLLFRLRFLSGVSKLASEDPSWANLSALRYYFETQPLPHAGAWFAHHLPDWSLTAGVLFTFGMELLVPFFIFLPRPFRLTAAGLTILMQLLIIATSNHNFINLLTIVLCLFLLDDRLLAGLMPARLRQRILARRMDSEGAGRFARAAIVVLAMLVLVTSVSMTVLTLSDRRPPALLTQIALFGRGFGFGNAYHVFPTMVTQRQELVIEGSHDGREWLPYRFRHKPNEVGSPLSFIVPHQPRLDWMIWFVPSRTPVMMAWFQGFMQRLWQNSAAVTGLLAENPFADRRPRYLRVLVYEFSFSTPQQRQQTGNWWRSELLGEFPRLPPRSP